MPTYIYRAKKGSSETVTGHIDARSQEEAIDLINQQGLLPVTIEEKISFMASVQSGGKRGRVTTNEVYDFSRQLASLIKSGIPILRALELIVGQTNNAYFRGILDSIVRKIRNGSTFSEALSDHPQIFNAFYIAMVRTGEESGRLKEMLLSLSAYLRSQGEIASRVRMALAYPILMAVVGVATVIFILTFVMPRITNLFSNAGEGLPLPTKILIALSHNLRAWGIPIVLVLIVISFFISRWSKTDAGRASLSRLKLQLPLFGKFILKADLARFCRTLELLLKSGVSIIKGINIAIPTLSNELIKADLMCSKKDLETGISLGASLKKTGRVPLEMANLIVVGEESGMLEEALGDLADSFEQETNETIKTMTTLLEPVMILVVGSIVGFIVIAMLLPIFQMDILAR